MTHIFYDAVGCANLAVKFFESTPECETAKFSVVFAKEIPAKSRELSIEFSIRGKWTSRRLSEDCCPLPLYCNFWRLVRREACSGAKQEQAHRDCA